MWITLIQTLMIQTQMMRVFKNETTKVEAGDNFVVIYNELENGDPFYVILCDQALHECEAIFEDDWGNTWYAGEMLLCNVWYHHVPDQ